MVKGLTHFAEYFKNYTANYILIGGAACDILMNRVGINFRATKDLDIILIVEAISPEFVKLFWKYIEKGGYNEKQKSTGERKYYRFLKPIKNEFPVQLELFARNPDLLDLDTESTLTPIPMNEDLSSLSAILMDEDYYKCTIKNSETIDNVHLASTESLICLKAKAYLDLKLRKQAGETIDEKNIKKHKNDVIRLAVLLTGNSSYALPKAVHNEMQQFMRDIEKESTDFKSIGKNMGIPTLNGQLILEQIKQTFSL
jgi:hypothetical protein